MRGHFTHVTGLHITAELSPQFVGAGFNHGVMRDADDCAVGTIQGHRDPSRLPEQLIQFFLKSRRRFIHESASLGSSRVPKPPSGRNLPRNPHVLLLTFSTPERRAQKLTCTPARIPINCEIDQANALCTIDPFSVSSSGDTRRLLIDNDSRRL